MAVELWINDGNPWYMSPDIWTVPSDDPNDPSGVPYANVSAYVWTRVRNLGSTSVTNATVKYYWANPSVTINDSNANLIGLSSVSLAPGEIKDVLCVTPWIPQWVNDGHECLLAEAFAPSDPMPPRNAATPYDVPGWRQMAQKNLTIGAPAANASFFMFPFMAGNLTENKAVQLIARREAIKILRPLAGSLGLKKLPEEAEGFDEFGLQPYRCGDEITPKNKPKVRLELPPRYEQGMALSVHLPKEFRNGTGALFLVEQMDGERVTGGVGVLIVPSNDLPVRGIQKRSRKNG